MKGSLIMENNAEKISSLEKEKLDPLLVKISLIMIFGSLAPLLDSTMVNIAIKTIAVDLNSTVSVIQWVTTGYVLAMAVVVPISGWAIQRFSGKYVYMFSLFLFLVGSVLSAVSWNIESLIAFRIIQGAGAGLLIPTLQTLLVQASGGKSLGSLMSLVGIPAVLGPILGPMLGGIIVDSLNWRWIFYVNIPITVIALFLSWFGLPKDKSKELKQKLDVIGISLLSSGFAVLIYGISKVSSNGGFNNKEVIIPSMIGLILLVIFTVYSLNKEKTVIDIRLFKIVNFSASSFLLFLSGIAVNGAMLLLPLYYQQVRGQSVFLTGVALIPQGVGMLLTRSQVGKLTDKIGSRVIVLVSLVVTILGTVPFAFANQDTKSFTLFLALLIRGAGLGGVTIPILASAYEGIDRSKIPDASIATRILQTIGGAFGSAVLATIVQHQILVNNATSIQGLLDAYHVAFLWSVGFAIIALFPALLLPVHKTE